MYPLTVYGQYTEYGGVTVPVILGITHHGISIRGLGATAQRLHGDTHVFAMMFPTKASVIRRLEPAMLLSACHNVPHRRCLHGCNGGVVR
jgi:hypothetical protein